jgi:hypothetical protein
VTRESRRQRRMRFSAQGAAVTSEGAVGTHMAEAGSQSELAAQDEEPHIAGVECSCRPAGAKRRHSLSVSTAAFLATGADDVLNSQHIRI